MPELTSDVRYIKGIGETRAKALEKLGIKTLFDLISYFPRDYEDRTNVQQIADLQPGVPACIEAYVVTAPRTSMVRKGMDITRCRLADNTSSINAVFFNSRHVAEGLEKGKCYFFYGSLDKNEDYSAQIINPTFELAEALPQKTRCIVPIYSLTAGISNYHLTRAIQSGFDACGDLLPDCLPEELRKRYQLCHARFAYENIHRPSSAEALTAASRRLIFEEFFIFSAGLLLLRSKGRDKSAFKLSSPDASAYLDALPFKLTEAQSRALSEITRDMASGYVMNRLVQGDVGSGKTAVAAGAVFLAAGAGIQSALMAPTEILARQHYNSLKAILEPLGIKVALLTGSAKAAERRHILEALETGGIDLLIGTHAIISPSVTFRKLGLVVADEQHRFGVAQRSALSSKGQRPHVLVMSATPIPRTLALMMYGELSISVIDQLPPGRQTVDTYLVDETMRQRINAFIIKQADMGRQIYIVCPTVEDSTDDMKAVETYTDELRRGALSRLRIGLVHGRLKAAEKEEVMAEFAAGRLDVLVSTTVIEVGVDVPNASLIVIENAERFGLSQLHQLRGRVGRGTHKSYCIMFSSNRREETIARLKVLCKTSDGFKIAEEDLKLRGPGDFFGSRQHGLPAFKIASLSDDIELMHQAKEAAEEYQSQIQSSPKLMARIRALFSENGNIFN